MMAACGLIFANPLEAKTSPPAVLIVAYSPCLCCILVSNPRTGTAGHGHVFRSDRPLQDVRSGSPVVGHFSPDYLFVRGDAHPVLHPPVPANCMRSKRSCCHRRVGIFRARKIAGGRCSGWIALGGRLHYGQDGDPRLDARHVGHPAYAILSARCDDPGTRAASAGACAIGALAVAGWNAATTLRRYFVVYPVSASLMNTAFEKRRLYHGSRKRVRHHVLTNWISHAHFCIVLPTLRPRRFQAGPVEYS